MTHPTAVFCKLRNSELHAHEYDACEQFVLHVAVMQELSINMAQVATLDSELLGEGILVTGNSSGGEYKLDSTTGIASGVPHLSTFSANCIVAPRLVSCILLRAGCKLLWLART